jgi:hypothetical protein
MKNLFTYQKVLKYVNNFNHNEEMFKIIRKSPDYFNSKLIIDRDSLIYPGLVRKD